MVDAGFTSSTARGGCPVEVHLHLTNEIKMTERRRVNSKERAFIGRKIP